VHHENAPIFIGCNEKSLEPVKSWYFLAHNLAPSWAPGKLHLEHLPCPAAELQNPLLQALGWGHKAVRVTGC